MNSLLNVGVVGATGMVGLEFLKVIEERKFPVQGLRLFAGEKSEGQKIKFRRESYEMQRLKNGCFDGLDLVFFSAGNPISHEWAPKAVKEGAFAIDNSSAYRMSPSVLLCVPEVNGHLLPAPSKPALIANPNCSTIQLVVVLNPLHQKFGLQEVKVSSYQAVSGAGREARDEFLSQTKDVISGKKQIGDLQSQYFPHPIAFNNIPQIGEFGDDGYSGEETKIMNETRKILDHKNLRISAFAVRTPTLNGHSEAVWVTLDEDVTKDELLRTLRPAPGLEVVDEVFSNTYPMNMTASGRDPVYVGRIRKDPNNPKTWLLWISADNIRKGAALNGIQIAEQIFQIGRSNG